MTAEPMREHLEWHLRRLKGARAAAAEMSLRADTDGLQWLSLTHFAVLALEATLAEEVAPDHKALEEVIGDLARVETTPPVAAESHAVHRDLPPLAETWSSALASFQALAFPWRRAVPAPPSRAVRDSSVRMR